MDIARDLPPTRQVDGLVVLNKPAGITSARCLAPFKRQGQKKIGHAGTLDPMASGVLLVLLGQATKLSSWLMAGGRKIYSGIMELGITTDTWDAEGEIISRNTCGNVTTQDISSAMEDWPRLCEQEVPAYSAAKHNGQPLYKIARKGHDVPVKVKKIEVFKADLLEISLPYVHFRVECGSGTYVRSLAHSLGMRLGCGATLHKLTREYSHPFNLDQACGMEAVQSGKWLQSVYPLTEAMPSWPRIELSASAVLDIRNGRPFHGVKGDDGDRAFLCHAGKPLAIARHEGAFWHIERGLRNT